MGLRGPAPKPRALKLIEGKYCENKREPEPAMVMPKCPSHLDKLAKREWKRLAPILMRMRVLTEADGIILGNLCTAYSTMIQAQEAVRQKGLVTKTESGFIMQNPFLKVANTAMEQVYKYAREFGLSPSSRTRIQMDIETLNTPAAGDLERALCG